MAAETKRRLGRGLDALLGTYASEGEPVDSGPTGSGRRTVPLGLISRSVRNPRREFPADDLAELAASLRQHGIVQPIVVRPVGAGGERFEIIAGERRWRAAQMAGLHDVPVTILDVSEREALELAIVENVQRTDLNPIEEARGYQALIEEFSYSQQALGEAIGKSRVHVTNMLRLLKLPARLLELLESGTLSAGHGRALLAAQDPEALADAIVRKGLSVREAERLAQAPSKAKAASKSRDGKSADVVALERELSGLLGLKVDLNHQRGGGGELRIGYSSLDQLDSICAKLRG